MLGKTLAILTVTAWLYYRRVWAVLALLPMGLWYYRQFERECVRKKQQKFEMQFKEMILAVSSALGTGYSIENALKESKKEMDLLYSDRELMSRELVILIRKLRVQIPVEQAVQELADTVGLEEVENFAIVFATAKRSGGDMIAIIKNTAHHISDKIDVHREIETMLAAKQYEFRVMSAVPYLIIAYMSLSFPEFMDRLYGNIAGTGVMTVCLMIYAGAYYLGVKLTEIEV